VDVRWTADPGLGTLEMSFGPSTTLVTQAAASGRVRAEHALLAAATTGILSVGAGSPTQLRIERTPGEPDDPIPAARSPPTIRCKLSRCCATASATSPALQP
jgi:hypothetical protein